MSVAIALFSHGPFSHADFILPGEGLLGASGPDASLKDPGGVLIRKFNPWPYLHPPKVAKLEVSDELAARVIARARTQIGKPFDNAAVWNIISGERGVRDWRALAGWFCAEFITWVLEVESFFNYTLITTKDRVTPDDLLLMVNPYMSEANIKEFIS